MSLLSLPVPAQAFSGVSSPSVFEETNPLAYGLEGAEIPSDVFSIQTGQGETSINVVADQEDSDRIYLLSETTRGETITLKFIYDDYLETVTLLFSSHKEGEEPRFTYYSRYGLGPSFSLDVLLEEGWVKGEMLSPFKIYDAAQGRALIRVFDRTGNLLRLESPQGILREFIHTQTGKLLAVKENASGGALYLNQILATLKHLEEPSQAYPEDASLYVLPSGKKDLLTSLQNRSISVLSLPGRFSAQLSTDLSGWYLEWMESAHPLRAGPKGAFLS
jgi:hypothetical protein